MEINLRYKKEHSLNIVAMDYEFYQKSKCKNKYIKTLEFAFQLLLVSVIFSCSSVFESLRIADSV